VYAFLDRNYVRCRSLAHALGRLSIGILAVIWALPGYAQFGQFNENCGPASQLYCDTVYPDTTATCYAFGGFTCGKTACVDSTGTVMALQNGVLNPNSSSSQCRQNNNSCQDKIDDEPLRRFVAFYVSMAAPATIASDETSLTAVVEAHATSQPIGESVCMDGCKATLQLPPSAEVSGVYAREEQRAGGGWNLYRRTDIVFDGVSCTASTPGLSTASVVATAVSPSEVGGSAGGGSTGQSCDADNKTAGCAKLEDVPQEAIPGVTVTLPGFSAETNHFGGGQCPANVFMTFHGINKNLKVWDWQQACQTMVTYVKPVVLVLGAIVALFIVLGISMPTQSSEQGA